MSRIQATDLRRTFAGRPPVEALRGVDLVVPDGTIVAVVGPSGCGKTTLLRAIAGLDRPDAGSVSLGDTTLDGPGVHVAPERRRIGLVPQEGALFPHLDVAANVRFGLRGWTKRERAERVEELLELIGLAGHGSRKAHELSGGQQQRVALARALAPRPVAVLLDEPFSALDAGLRGALRDEVCAVLRTTGTTAVLVTHDQTEALTTADQVAVMRDGRVVQSGEPSQLYRRPADLWIARFLGDVVELGPGSDRHVQVCRPEQLRPTVEGGRPDLRGTVIAVRFGGPDAEVTIEVDGRPLLARWPSTELPAVGDAVEVSIEGPTLTLPARVAPPR